MRNFCEALNCSRTSICKRGINENYGLVYLYGEYKCKPYQLQNKIKFIDTEILWDCIYITRDGKLENVCNDTYSLIYNVKALIKHYREPIKIIACFEKFKKQIKN